MKKIFALLLVAAALVSLAVPALAEVPEIKRVEYDGRGYVEVDFVYDVQYSNVQVNVVDATGFSYSAVVRELDEDDISFVVESIVPGKEYNFSISGVRSGFSGEYESVSGSFVVPAEGEILIKSVDYDADDRELDIEFSSRVEYNNPIVKIQDASGSVYEGRIIEKDRDSIEVRVGELKRGDEYSVTVEGLVGADGSAVYANKSFIAR